MSRFHKMQKEDRGTLTLTVVILALFALYADYTTGVGVSVNSCVMCNKMKMYCYGNFLYKCISVLLLTRDIQYFQTSIWEGA